MLSDTSLLLFILQTLLFFSILNNPEISHIGINLFPLILLLSEFFSKIQTFAFVKRLSFFRAYIVFALYLYLSLFVGYRIANTAQSNVAQAAYHTKAVEEMAKLAHGKEIFSFPFLPNMHFILGKKNPYRYSILIENANTEEDFQTTLSRIRERKPDIVFTNHDSVKKYGHAYQNPIDDYIKKNYRQIKRYGAVIIWERNSETSE